MHHAATGDRHRRVAGRAGACRRTTAAAFLAELFPKLVAYHEWLYRERDPDECGLVTLIHPWECGLDTTPPWMQAMARMPSPWWARAATRLHLAHVVRFLRRDTKYVPSVQRPTDDEGLADARARASSRKRHGFELRADAARSLGADPGPRVQLDPRRRQPIVDADRRRTRRTACRRRCWITSSARPAAIEELWDEDTGEYFSRDAVDRRRSCGCRRSRRSCRCSRGAPSPERAEQLIAQLRAPGGFWPRFPVPTVPTDAPEFRDEAYWKGPTWLNMNWMIVEALDEHHEADLAEQLRQRSLELVDAAGCSEYFSPLTGRGYGAPEFSWTAALVLELLAQTQIANRRQLTGAIRRLLTPVGVVRIRCR